ncbi:general substrate transporter [Boeremia exigua]|uniref:general substrate transporter n=1 Tax=Boeremia exigua TaxID=749465 RepID=UPI001E8CAB46|nr:general substrate transporter [Boeremia exigua]KAH6618791.1 general substrate transporter [Boeremia exigua]
MEKPTSVTHHEETITPDGLKRSITETKGAIADNITEHQLTLGDVWRDHRALIGWSFYWSMCAIGWGFDAQINGAMISVASFRRDFGYIFDGEPVLPASWQTAFNMVSSVGMLFGGFGCSTIADKFGRRASLLCGVLFCIGGAFGEMFSLTRVAFLLSKLILGVGLGFYLTIGPLVCSEISPVVLRGISTAGINLGIALGQLLSNAVVKGFGERTDRWAYAAPFAIQLIFSVFLLCGLPWAPESPWYLVRKGKDSEAVSSLQRLWGQKIDVTDKLASLKLTIQEEERQKESSFLDCFRGINLLRSSISMGVFACQHLVGIVFVLGYSTYFFQLAGLDTSRSFDLGVGVTACGVAGNIASWFVVDSFGRRKVFISGMACLTGLLILIGIMDVVPTGPSKWVQASCTVIYAFVYFMTLGAMAFVLLGEVSSMGLRAHTTALATATQAVVGTVMNVAIPYLVNPDEANLKGKVGFVFGGLAAIATLGSWVFVPELKGRTNREIDTMFIARVPPRKMGSFDLDETTA